MSKMKSRIEITARVTTVVEHNEGEDLTDRVVDIYLHGECEDGSMDKQDCGAYDWEINVVETKPVAMPWHTFSVGFDGIKTNADMYEMQHELEMFQEQMASKYGLRHHDSIEINQGVS